MYIWIVFTLRKWKNKRNFKFEKALHANRNSHALTLFEISVGRTIIFTSRTMCRAIGKSIEISKKHLKRSFINIFQFMLRLFKKSREKLIGLLSISPLYRCDLRERAQSQLMKLFQAGKSVFRLLTYNIFIL